MRTYNIYEEGFQVMEGSATAHYLGAAQGETFIDACKNFIRETQHGCIKVDNDGNEYASDWDAAGSQLLKRRNVHLAK